MILSIWWKKNLSSCKAYNCPNIFCTRENVNFCKENHCSNTFCTKEVKLVPYYKSVQWTFSFHQTWHLSTNSIMICISLVGYDWSIWWHIRLFSLLDHPLICSSKAIWKRKLDWHFLVHLSLIKSVHWMESPLVGRSSFQKSESLNLDLLVELILSSDIVEASRFFGGRLCEAPWVHVPLPLIHVQRRI